MTTAHQQARLRQGDVLEVLRDLPSESVHMAVCSPPYWGLRNYHLPPTIWDGESACSHYWGEEQVQRRRGALHGEHAQAGNTKAGNTKAGVSGVEVRQGQVCRECGAWRGCLGSEPDPEMYVRHLVQVFREVRRVLRDDGTLWLNMGDSYSGSGRGNSEQHPGPKQQTSPGSLELQRSPTVDGLKPLDLCNIPHRVAQALQAAGWYWRSTIVWAKPNPMPESVQGWRWEQHQIPTGVGPRCTWPMPVDQDGHLFIEELPKEMVDCPSCSKCSPNNGFVFLKGSGRPTTAHEYVFMFSKTADYYYDSLAVAEPVAHPAGATNLASPSRSTVREESLLALGTDQMTPKALGRSFTLDPQDTVITPMACYAENFEIGQTIRFSVIVEEAEWDYVVDLQALISATSGTPIPVALEHQRPGLLPTGASIVEVAPTPGWTILTSLVQAYPLAEASLGTKIVWPDGAGIFVEGFTTRITLDSEKPGSTLSVRLTFPTHFTLLRRRSRNNTIAGRNLRSVWTLATEPTSLKHFATFPQKLVERCILAGSSAKGVCGQCGAPWARVLEKAPSTMNIRVRDAKAGRAAPHEGYKASELEMEAYGQEEMGFTQTLGWRPTCKHSATVAPTPATILDPFTGTGTSQVVASRLGRDCIGIDLSAKYLAMARKRLRQGAMVLGV